MTIPNHPWDDQEMADLVGLHLPEPASEPGQEVVSAHTVSETEPLLDAEDINGQALRDPKPRLSLAANPFTKLGVVAAGTGLVIGVLAVFTSGVIKNDSPPTEEAQADFPAPMVEETEMSATDDRGQLLTDLALGRQQAELEALANEEQTAAPEAPTARETPELSSAPPSPPPQPVATQPAPPLPRPTPAPPSSTRPVAAQPVPQAVVDPVDPMERWLALSQVGSYGQGSPLPQVDTQPSSPPLTTTPMSVPGAVAQVSRSSPPDINHVEEAAILQGQPVTSFPTSPLVLTGSQASAVLETPLIWAEAAETDRSQFVVQLTEPLLTATGDIGLPADTSLVVQVTSVADSGLVQLTVVSFIQGGQETPLPAGTLQLRGVEGTPLIAQKYDDPGMDIARMDATMAAMAGLSRAMALVNRPRTSSVITSAGGSAITQDAGDANLLAGMLEGAFEQLLGQMETRNQAALDELLNRPVIWHLPTGTEVDVYVNQTVAL
ncbi:TrbI/VirB10 family protein [Leptolyngbya sp. CCY15150]|uniref:TrbI/VirB10 family protein n=1 Tax=Leptolyngbya sp. CCY15150 TaxID=2767772 RepID=UPI001951D6AA|nr:TrbI/VirB10 family protein [Leptolyngbya sp. CCY15150]